MQTFYGELCEAVFWLSFKKNLREWFWLRVFFSFVTFDEKFHAG